MRAADVANGVDAEHDHQPEADRHADVAELTGLEIDHDGAAPGEDERKRPDRFGGKTANDGTRHPPRVSRNSRTASGTSR